MQRNSLALLLSAALLIPGTLSCNSDPSTDQVELKKAPPEAWQDAVIESYDKTSNERTMRIEIFEMGTGEVVEVGDRVTVHYQGWMPNQKFCFDSSFTRGQPHSFTIGGERVIPGWELGIEGLAVGTKARLHVPSSLGYGEGGRPPQIPGNQDLIFDIKLVSFL